MLKHVDPDKHFYQKCMDKEPIDRKKYVYEQLEDISLNPSGKLKLILTTTVEGVRGDIIEVWKEKAYLDLLPSGYAVYASPENLENFMQEKIDDNMSKNVHSAFASGVIRRLKEMKLRILMNADNDWTLDSNHISIAFRHAGIIVPPEAITLPTLIDNDHPQSITKNNCLQKNFRIGITVNNIETIQVDAFIELYSKNPLRMKEILKMKEQMSENRAVYINH
ncbi:unnamed protein product [Gordionus sp. m RMFG-2023]